MSPNDRAHITATAQNVQVIAPIYFYAFVALFRPFGLNTGSSAPYFALRAQYGLKRALFRPAGLNTGSVAPYFALRAQYGLKRAYVLTALRAYGASYAIAPCGGNTLRGYGYVLGLLPCAHTP